ncbi:MAG: peptidoglycan DD-metalloendopeptidase family protein [Rhodothermales bacterium]
MAARTLAVLMLVVLSVHPAAGQDADSRQGTEERLEEIKAQIEADEQLLSETVEAERASLETLENLDRQIALRQELIRNYGRRVRQITHEMDTLRAALNSLEEELNGLKRQYRSRAIHAYKYGRMHDLALILSAGSINQMLVRVRYLHRFADQRRDRLSEIQQTASQLRTRRDELQSVLARNEQLLREEQREQENLQRLQESRQEVIAQLRDERSTIQQSLETKREAAQELENRIRELAEAASSRRRVREASNPEAAAEFVEMTGSFLDNEGALPWPARGVVRERFGNIINPVYGTTTPNPGMIIDTQASAEVRSIFDGQIIDVSILPEYGTYVVVEHGTYKSVYSNFSMTYVSEGDEVQAGQLIGRAGTDAEPKGMALFFALFKEGVPIDPEPWLAPQ